VTTPTALRAQAADHDRAAHESFERCDTDGFMSQWAHGLSAEQKRLQADIEEDGGRATFLALFDTDGELVPAKWIETRYGLSWALLESDDPRSRFIGWFNPSKASDAKEARRRDAAKGFYVGYVKAPARAELRGGNACTVRAVPVRTDGGFSRDVIVVDDGQHDEYGEVLGRWYAVHGNLL
jgi:hypothetical protein